VCIHSIPRGTEEITNIPLISLSQLSCLPEQRTGDHRPQLADLREPGSIEQDADLEPSSTATRSTTKRPKKKGSPTIIIAKQRNGPIGDFKLVFRNDITKFFNYEPQRDFVPE
jgi:replicative DNA helicase